MPEGRILKPGIVWGQHRNTERIAMGVKRLLEADPDIRRAQIPFVEFEQWKIDDYVEVLYRFEEMVQRGEISGDDYEKGWPDAFFGVTRELNKWSDGYRRSIGDEYGSLMFNLHDGNKINGSRHDIEFWISPRIDMSDSLALYLEGLGSLHGIDVLTLHEGKIGKCASPFELVTVEFLTPKPERTRTRFFSEDVRQKVARYAPNGLRDDCYTYKVMDMSDPLYEQAARKYAVFMKDVLLGVGKMGFREK